MRMTRTLASGGLLLASLAGTAAIATPAHAAATPAYTACHDGVDPNGFNPADNTTPNQTVLFGRIIQLRYNTNHCVWGRIQAGAPGDHIWVDRSLNGGVTWQSKRASATIGSGTEAITFALYDAGAMVVSRACGQAGNRIDVACTGWY
jgi:hypothetical protein